MLARSWLGAALATSSVCVLLSAGCADEPPGPDIKDGAFGGATVDVMGVCPKNPTQCGENCVCGEGCCATGETCVAGGGRCWKREQCQTTADCVVSDTYCIGNTCVPYTATGAQTNDSCRLEADLPTLVPQLKCRWPGDATPEERPDSLQVVSTPMVIDFNFDDDPATIRPSIVFVSYAEPFSNQDGVLRIIDGETCAEQFTIAIPDLKIPPEASPAVGNLDAPTCPRACPAEGGDARPEIVFPAVDYNTASPTSHIVAYRYDPEGRNFVEWWDTETTTSVDKLLSISIHDLDGDGDPEVLTADQVLDPNGSTAGEVLVAIPFQGGRGLIEPPVVTDVSLDGFPEIVTSQGIYSWSLESERPILAEFWPEDNVTPVQSAFTAVANLTNKIYTPVDGDPPEMITVDPAGYIYVMSVAGRVVLRSTIAGNSGGPPTVADFDGDGKPEYGSASRTAFTVYDLDCRPGEDFDAQSCATKRTGDANAVLWSTTLPYASTGTSGSSVFDFDDNGSAEVVYADQCFLRIIDGKTGNVLHSVPRSSRTRFEYPVIADVDADGHADIVIGSNNDAAGAGLVCPETDRLKDGVSSEMTRGLAVWGNDGWAGARHIWNQYDYFVTHVDDNGQIPNGRTAKRHWMVGEGTNTFRENVASPTEGSFSFDQADLTTLALPGYECRRQNDGSFKADIQVQVCNRGLVDMAGNVAEISLMKVGDTSATPMCSVKVVQPLTAGTCATVPCGVTATNQIMNVEIVGDPANRISECIESNNRAQLVEVRCNDVIQ